jgi:ATP-dependent helicase HrpA
VQEAGSFGRGELIDAIIADIREQITITVLTSDFKPETLPAHHFMNFKVIDEHGRQLDMGATWRRCRPNSARRRARASRKWPRPGGRQHACAQHQWRQGAAKTPVQYARPRPAGGEGRRCR